MPVVCRLSEDRGASSNNAGKEGKHKSAASVFGLINCANQLASPALMRPVCRSLGCSFQANREGEDKQDSEHCKHGGERTRRTLCSVSFRFVVRARPLFPLALGAAAVCLPRVLPEALLAAKDSVFAQSGAG